MSIGHVNVQSSNGRVDMCNASITCKHLSAGVPHHELLHNSFQYTKDITSIEFYINWCQISIMSIGHTQMSNGPLDEKKCPLDIKMSTCPLDE